MDHNLSQTDDTEQRQASTIQHTENKAEEPVSQFTHISERQKYQPTQYENFYSQSY